MSATETVRTMKAVTRDRYGDPDVLGLCELPLPVPTEQEVVVRVHAAAVNPADVHTTRGVPYLGRPMSYGLLRPKHPIAGIDFAGTVEARSGTDGALQPGDEVFGFATGAFAEYAAVPARSLERKPANLTFEQAAVVPTAAGTALQALRDLGGLQPGQRVLVVGASGGVGTFAIQIARALGAETTGVTSTRNVDLVRSTGAEHVVDYTHEDFTTTGKRYDLIVDLVGNRPLLACRRALEPDGTLVVVGSQHARSLTGMGRFARAAALSPFVRQRLRPLFAQQRRDDLTVLKQLIEAGKVLPVIDRTYPLAEARDALRHVDGAHARGKVVIVP
ncbi:MAG: NAD(P)-dependent alcohol dehydrogenase [Thermoleophilia bacterium]